MQRYEKFLILIVVWTKILSIIVFMCTTGVSLGLGQSPRLWRSKERGEGCEVRAGEKHLLYSIKAVASLETRKPCMYRFFIHSCVPMVLSVATLGESGRAERQAAKPSALAQRTNQETYFLLSSARRKKQRNIFLTFSGAEKEAKKHPPPPRPPPIWGGCN